MKLTKIAAFSAVALTFLLMFAVDSIFAQGRGRGGGRPTSNPGMTRPNTGVDRGINTSSTRSNGRSDAGREKASERSNGRSDDGIDRARTGGGNRNMPGENELNRYRGISRKLGTTPETLRDRYEAALAANPDLKFGQFVAAHVIADNLGGRNPDITATAILRGLERGDSIGRTLRNLGVSSDEARRLEREAKRQIEESRRRKD